MSLQSLNLINKLEQLAANSWPAPTQEKLEHWQLRAGTGVTMRANSVLTSGSFPHNPDWLVEVQSFYKARSLPLRFHLSAATDPKVDAFLETQGLTTQSPSAVYSCACEDILKDGIKSNPLLMTSLKGSLEDDWLDDFLRLEQHPIQRKPAYVQIFSGIKLKMCYLRIYERDELVGLGTAVLEENWAGFGNIITSEGHRNKGIGTKIIHELAYWSKINGAEMLYLQVLRSNEAALRLYTKLGFAHVYDYHYRILG